MELSDQQINYLGDLITGGHIRDVGDEFREAVSRFPPFNSAHEGYAIIKEELDELWEEVRTKQGQRDVGAMYNEAKQVAAMAIRFMVDICGGDRGQV